MPLVNHPDAQECKEKPIAIMGDVENCLDSKLLADVLSTSGNFVRSHLNGRLLKLVDRTDLGSVGDEP
jgi:hypothetical protein